MAFGNSIAKLSELPLSLRTSFFCTTASHSYQLSTLRPFSITAKYPTHSQPKRLSKALPCHFALGRNRNLQGLAVAILKLWEKSLVVKIAVKCGILNTNNELMAEELKKLTGGTLLIRNKYFIVIYHRKDFVPTSVAAVLAERQEMTKQVVDDEEKAWCRAIDVTQSGGDEATTQAGSLAEFYEAQARWGRDISAKEREKMIRESAKAKNIRLFRKVERKLALAQTKRLRAENLLAKIEASLDPADPDCDQETISEEERAMFRRVGLIMKPYLPLGIRGVFDGVIGICICIGDIALSKHITELGRKIEVKEELGLSHDLEPEDRGRIEDLNQIDHMSESTQSELEDSDGEQNDGDFGNEEDSDWDFEDSKF